MSGKVDRLEIMPGFHVVSTRGSSPFRDEIRKEVRRIAEAVRRASDKPAGLPRKQPQTKRRVPVG
jgi:hypothetical protein